MSFCNICSSITFLAAAFGCLLVSYIKNVEAGTFAVYRLSSGYEMPVFGLTTETLYEETLEKVLSSALDAGIRYIDTATMYLNEETIGKVLKKWFDRGGRRENIFVTSKLPFYHNRPEEVERNIKLSLQKLGLNYLDMYLIHAPFATLANDDDNGVCVNKDGSVILDTASNPMAVWRAMEKQVAANRTLSIGLSNFNKTQIADILKIAKIKPSLLQVELHAYHQQKVLREFCHKNGIIVAAYSPLGSPEARKFLHPRQTEQEFPPLYTLPVVNEIAKRYKKTAVQILFNHLVYKGAAVLIFSRNPIRNTDNIEIYEFHLSPDETMSLDALDKGEKGKIFDFKNYKGIEKHPYYPFTREIY